MNPLAAAVAFFALGVTAFGSSLLLLFNPRGRGVRWFVLFQACIAVWLGAQGWAFSTDGWASAGPIAGAAVHLAPGFFLAFALAGLGGGTRLALASIALGVLLLPLQLASPAPAYAGPLLTAWTGLAWTLATVTMVRRLGRSMAQAAGGGKQRRLAWTVLGLMALVFPVGMLGGALDSRLVGIYVMPLLMVWIQGLVFIGVARLRFYDIEVRAARTGAVAAGAAEQERLAVVGELAASLAHEIRNPLTGVRSLAQRLAEDEVDEVKRRRYAGVILEEVGRVERLVANLLGIARRAPRGGQGGGHTELGPLFEDLGLLVGSRAGRAGVRLEAEGGGLTAAAAREPLAQALLNLLLNALAHAPAGTAVRLAARGSAQGVEISVRDQGPGVAPAERERIWEPFVSGGEGTGLGLAVVRRLAREQGWTVALRDPAGGGAEFVLTIPGPQSPAAQS